MSHKRPNIALLGPPGSGKSFVAEAWGSSVGFADGVKEEVAWAVASVTYMHFGDDRVRMEAEKLFILLMTDDRVKQRYRALLQVWGTEFRRAQDPDYWVKKFRERYEGQLKKYATAVVDCRFPNEYEYLKQRRFKFVKLDVDGPYVKKLTAAQAAHESEAHWPLFDFDVHVSHREGADKMIEAIETALGTRTSP